MKTKIKPVKAPAARNRSKDLEKGEAILEAAIACMLENGFDRSSMDEIAKRADVSKQTVYSHFNNKENLFSEAVSMVAKRVTPREFANDLGGLGLRDSLTALGKNFVKLVLSEESYCVHKMINSETANAQKIARLFYEAGPKVSQDSFKKLLEYWVDRGELKIDDVNTAMMQLLALLKGQYYFERILGLRKELTGAQLNKHVDQSIDAFIKLYGNNQ